MKRKFQVLYIAAGILLSFIILLTSVEILSFSLKHYENSFQKYGIPQVTGMDMENLMHTIEDVLSYLRDEKDELDTKAIVRGREREVFGEREKLHMIDVKNLFIKGRGWRNRSLILLVILLLILIKKDSQWKKRLSKTMFYTAVSNFLLLGLLLLLLFFDFYKYFTYFHLIFFDNDLWMLDPETEILVQMLPEEFFYETAVKIILLFMGTMSILGIGGMIYSRKRKKQE